MVLNYFEPRSAVAMAVLLAMLLSNVASSAEATTEDTPGKGSEQTVSCLPTGPRLPRF